MQLKPITREGIPAALQKAERYRLLNESSAAESICLDVLAIDPKNQEALISLLLSITDQFAEDMAGGVRRAREVVPRLDDEYERLYYSGIICERRARAQLHRGSLGRIAGRGGMVSRSDDLVRESREDAPRRQRRGDSALEHVRADARATRAAARALRVRARPRRLTRSWRARK